MSMKKPEIKKGSLDRIREKFGHHFDEIDPQEIHELFRGHSYECTENERKFLDRIKEIGQYNPPGTFYNPPNLCIGSSYCEEIDFPGIDLQNLVEKK